MPRPAVPVLLLTAALAGCGGGPTAEEDVRATVTRFAEASSTKDYQQICDELLAPALVRNVEQFGLPCELAIKQGLGDVKAPKLTLGAVRVTGERATATVTTTATGQQPSTDTIGLRLIDDEWRIASLAEA